MKGKYTEEGLRTKAAFFGILSQQPISGTVRGSFVVLLADLLHALMLITLYVSKLYLISNVLSSVAVIDMVLRWHAASNKIFCRHVRPPSHGEVTLLDCTFWRTKSRPRSASPTTKLQRKQCVDGKALPLTTAPCLF